MVLGNKNNFAFEIAFFHQFIDKNNHNQISCIFFPRSGTDERAFHKLFVFSVHNFNPNRSRTNDTFFELPTIFSINNKNSFITKKKSFINKLLYLVLFISENISFKINDILSMFFNHMIKQLSLTSFFYLLFTFLTEIIFIISIDFIIRHI